MTGGNAKFTKLDVVSGKSYFICQCGQSARYPLCDGSHKNTAFNPENMSRLRVPPSVCVDVKNTKLQSVVVLKRSITNASNSKTIGTNK